jgi:hypothetical protein
MVLCSSCEILSLKLLKKLAGPQVHYTGSIEPSHAPKFEWPDTADNRRKTFNPQRFLDFLLLMIHIPFNTVVNDCGDGVD